MIKCVLFDMDGVIVNTEPIGYKANQDMYKALGIIVPDSVYNTFVGNSDKNIVAKLKDLYEISLTHEELLEKQYEYYFKAFDTSDDVELLPGVKDLIIDLHSSGIKLIVASSASNAKIEKVFTRFGLHSYFDAKLSGEDFEFSKPNPAIYIEAANQSGFTKEECIVIEDSTNGIKAAKAAGIYCIGYESGLSIPQDTSEADIVITDFDQLNSNKIKGLPRTVII
ncbi:HAD family phosphatase [Flavobacterium arcticum]|uniref:HAD family phosphatase n=1 Tax=Flavobacterium arcticum TaxID=1784713 RepID=A0A345HCY9_9FLAO|nr:HAD family phosphatase [Flavobacterium arcticum]AXG74449.1 HAD family phosphatase [Flavobacterium arcticum]KAF2512430.1 HAD family phosphatase [Flavobacterium arcticum]